MAHSPEALEQNIALQPQNNAEEVALNLLQDVQFVPLAIQPADAVEMGAKKIQAAFAPEIVVGDLPLSVPLPGNSSFDADKFGNQSVTTYNKFGKAKEGVTVDANGNIKTWSADGGNFQIRQEGNRQYVTTPNGDTVVVERNRIVKTNTGGQTTEMLTPKEFKERERQREAERQLQIDKEIKEISVSISKGLANGNVPVNEIRQAYETAQLGFWGPEGIERLTRVLNAVANGDGHSVNAAINVKTGNVEVTVQNMNNNDMTRINVTPIRLRKMQILDDRAPGN